jgi:hypothetical protein
MCEYGSDSKGITSKLNIKTVNIIIQLLNVQSSCKDAYLDEIRLCLVPDPYAQTIIRNGVIIVPPNGFDYRHAVNINDGKLEIVSLEYDTMT